MKHSERDSINLDRSPVKTRTKRAKCGFKWLDEHGNVIKEIKPTPPCKQYIEILPEQTYMTGIDVEQLLKYSLSKENV